MDNEQRLQDKRHAYGGHMTREFNGENAYRDDTNLTYDPPMAGLARSHVVMDGKWLGPCK